MICNRPTDRELDRQIKAAKAALIKQNGLYANLNKATGELYDLEIESPNQVWELILELLDEICPGDYAGESLLKSPTRKPSKTENFLPSAGTVKN